MRKMAEAKSKGNIVSLLLSNFSPRLSASFLRCSHGCSTERASSCHIYSMLMSAVCSTESASGCHISIL